MNRPMPAAPTSILQDWVTALPIRYQGCLLGAIRGCDTLVKRHPAKTITRILRGHVLNPACGDPRKATSFIEWCEDEHEFDEAVTAFHNESDAMPHHFVMHLIHAAQILGYRHPTAELRALWLLFYIRAVRKMHLAIENEHQLELRLTADEETFGKDQ